MEAQYKLNDVQIKQEMEDASLHPGLFSHEAHLRWGWLLLEDHGLDRAIKTACDQLKNYTKSLGVADKYNETVTVAAIRAIHHFRLRSETLNFADFIEENPRLKTSFKELMAAHYSEDIFQLAAAKVKYIKPDLQSFD